MNLLPVGEDGFNLLKPGGKFTFM